MIFDGRGFAKELEVELKAKIAKLGRRPVLATIYNPEEIASRVYTEIKAKVAERIGVKFLIFNFKFLDNKPISEFINDLNNDDTVDGIMIQTPLIDRETDKKLCSLIRPKKDVDGLNPESGIISATAKAVLKILEFSRGHGEVVVVGQRGLVGSEVLKRIPGAIGMSAGDLNLDKLKNADVIILATGKENLIKPEMIKSGAVCIDVGYPKGDFVPSTALRASFFTPVPGGVGPVTVICLFENVVELLCK